MKNKINIDRRSFLKTSLAGAGIAALSPSVLIAARAQKKRPNIILIMSDDMGFSDLGCYGGEIETPNLDKIAENGVRFTHCYNAARCCPSRAAIMSGLYSHRAGMGGMVTGNPQKNNPVAYRGELSPNAVTLAQVLKPAGYHTYMTGKWHITGNSQLIPGSPDYNWPLQRGFDKFYGILAAGRTHYDPAHLMRDNKHITPDNDAEYKPKKKYHFIDAITDNTVEYLKQHKKEHAGEPFFFYVAQYAAHFPLHAHEDDIKKYKHFII
jgi:arylsulfatase A-like enzyme